ncbi:MAG: glucose 1-dehydrogenase [Chloroflexota bacterium]|nr:glucose 1-dehydrogenase [Chloroflexota bacterium]
MGDWSGKVAFVTGGSQGIGRAVAELLAESGAAVGVCGLEADVVGETVATIKKAGGEALATPADVTNRASIHAAVDATVKRYGRLDALVTSAGIQRYGTVMETDEATWDEVLAVNVKGVYLAAQAALPHLRRSGQGSIVVISSVQAHVSQRAVAAYSASKGALDALVRAMAVDEAPHGVRVNAVCPGSVDTPMLRSSARRFSDGSAEGAQALVDTWGRSHPLGRVANPREVAEVVSFLAGPRASFVTGEDLRVDGGLLATVGVALPD